MPREELKEANAYGNEMGKIVDKQQAGVAELQRTYLKHKKEYDDAQDQVGSRLVDTCDDDTPPCHCCRFVAR